MEHVVFFPSPDGAPAFRRLPSLDEAVRLVEHLRNVEGVSQVSCHTLSEVPLAFRAYYRVEVDGETAMSTEEPLPEEQPLATEPELAPVMALPEHEQEQLHGHVEERVRPQEHQPHGERHLVVAQAASNGHPTGGAKSLGFFA
ncbi:MAG: hypothetical protein ABIO67_10515 [Mycobacteriales bacterium]